MVIQDYTSQYNFNNLVWDNSILIMQNQNPINLIFGTHLLSSDLYKLNGSDHDDGILIEHTEVHYGDPLSEK